MSWYRKTIADLKNGDTVWVHDALGRMTKGKLVDGDVVAGKHSTTFEPEHRVGIRAQGYEDVQDTPGMRVYWEGRGISHDRLIPFWFVFSERQPCQDSAWAITNRRAIGRLIETTDVRTLKRIGRLLGVPRPSKHKIQR